MNHIYAYTEPKGSDPAFINFSERRAGVIAVTVRTAGNNGSTVATIDLDPNQLKIIANHINGYLGTSDAAPDEEVRFDAILDGLNKTVALLRQQVDLMQASRDDHREAMTRYDAMTQAYEATAVAAVKSVTVSALQPHQQRVVDEKVELEERLAKLVAFTRTPAFEGLDEAERNRLDQQAACMAMYADILTDRIAAFTPAAAGRPA